MLIIEGISGSGKSTLFERIKRSGERRALHALPEEALLLSWEHKWIPDIERTRLRLFEGIVARCRAELERDAEAFFLLERFHVSHRTVAEGQDPAAAARYEALVGSLRSLPVHIFFLELNREDIRARAEHAERGPVWRAHQERKLALRGLESIEQMYAQEQESMRALLVSQGIPYSTIISAGQPER